MAAPAQSQAGHVGAWQVRALHEHDIEALAAMERRACAHPLHAWTAQNYRSCLASGYWAVVAEDLEPGRPVGALVVMDGVDELHLLNIVVDRDWQGRGLAAALMDLLQARAQALRAQAVWLEVRPSNERARALYRRRGFEDVASRKAYYPAVGGREDAWVMRCTPDAMVAGQVSHVTHEGQVTDVGGDSGKEGRGAWHGVRAAVQDAQQDDPGGGRAGALE